MGIFTINANDHHLHGAQLLKIILWMNSYMTFVLKQILKNNRKKFIVFNHCHFSPPSRQTYNLSNLFLNISLKFVILMYAPTFKCKEKLFTKAKPIIKEIDILYSQSTMKSLWIYLCPLYKSYQLKIHLSKDVHGASYVGHL